MKTCPAAREDLSAKTCPATTSSIATIHPILRPLVGCTDRDELRRTSDATARAASTGPRIPAPAEPILAWFHGFLRDGAQLTFRLESRVSRRLVMNAFSRRSGVAALAAIVSLCVVPMDAHALATITEFPVASSDGPGADHGKHERVRLVRRTERRHDRPHRPDRRGDRVPPPRFLSGAARYRGGPERDGVVHRDRQSHRVGGDRQDRRVGNHHGVPASGWQRALRDRVGSRRKHVVYPALRPDRHDHSVWNGHHVPGTPAERTAQHRRWPRRRAVVHRGRDRGTAAPARSAGSPRRET